MEAVELAALIMEGNVMDNLASCNLMSSGQEGLCPISARTIGGGGLALYMPLQLTLPLARLVNNELHNFLALISTIFSACIVVPSG